MGANSVANMTKDPWDKEFEALCFWCNHPFAPMRLIYGVNGLWCGMYCTLCGGPHRLPEPDYDKVRNLRKNN